jgi:hypothetical protein
VVQVEAIDVDDEAFWHSGSSARTHWTLDLATPSLLGWTRHPVDG